MDTTSTRKVVAKVDLSHRTSPSPRPASPYKSSNNALLRPKAKVNSSAKINTSNGARRVSGTMSAVSSPVVRTPASSSIPRPASPVKHFAPPVGRSQSAHTSSASYGGSSRPKAVLTQTDVTSRQRALTNTSNSSLSATSHSTTSSLQHGARARTSSGTFNRPLTPVANNIHLSPDPNQPTNAIRVKSKVSNLAKGPGQGVLSAPTSPLHVSRANSTTTSGASSPPYATTGRPVRKVRSPPMPDFAGPSSVPSSPVLSSPPPPSIHATITPPSSTLSEQRRPSVQLRQPSPLGRPFPSSPTPAPAPHSQPRAAKVDVSTLPPLPNSPPGSTVSFSSHSSRSSLSQIAYSSTSEASSTAPTVNSHVNTDPTAVEKPGDDGRYGGLPDQRGVFDAIVGLFDPGSRRTSAATTVDPNREGLISPSPSTLMPSAQGSQIRAAAKSNRKIEDLEITNRSLLAINQSLEGQKLKQAKEIRDLRRKLRESRLILPPRAYRALKSSDGPAPADEPTASSSEDDEDAVPDAQDETYERVKGLLGRLLEDAKTALNSTPEDHRGAKVLNAEELRDWRDDSFTSHAGDVSIDLGDVSIDYSEADPTEGAQTAGPNSEDEVEASLLTSQLRGPLPSVKVTMS
ncbi:hypothetical protein PENSPDRAFT_425249 [Peniophora sp. CONT]|nr:hypothetical protein PENSPDRAFT_425249 [Peniophora sp. CONT]